MLLRGWRQAVSARFSCGKPFHGFLLSPARAQLYLRKTRSTLLVVTAGALYAWSSQPIYTEAKISESSSADTASAGRASGTAPKQNDESLALVALLIEKLKEVTKGSTANSDAAIPRCVNNEADGKTSTHGSSTEPSEQGSLQHVGASENVSLFTTSQADELIAELSQLSDRLHELASPSKLAEEIPTLPEIAEKASALLSSIPSSEQMRSVSNDVIKIVEELSAHIPKGEVMKEISKQIPSTEEITSKAVALLDDVTTAALERMMEGTIIAGLKSAITDAERNPEITWDAKVRVGSSLCQEEQDFIQRRKIRVAHALSKITGETVLPEDAPVIAIGASGGGCRAMIANLACLETLDNIGLLDGTCYLAGVSGSTWAMAQLYSTGRDFKAVRNRLSQQLCTNYLSLSDLVASVNNGYGERVLAGIAQKYFSAQSFSTVDIFGTLLTARLVVPDSTSATATRTMAAAAQAGADLQSDSAMEINSDGRLGDSQQLDRGKLSYQKWAMNNQELPMPIYTAVSHEVVDSETSHYQARTRRPLSFMFRMLIAGSVMEEKPDTGAWVPVWSFGRVFDHGESQEALPELSLGLLLGTFGSAFTATVAHIWAEFKDALPEALCARVLPLLEDISQIHPISPATFPNILYGMGIGRLSHEPVIGLMDSGMDNNLPFPPLLRPEREVDVMIMLDASTDVGADPWLLRGEAFARRHGMAFPSVPKPTADSKTSDTTDPLRRNSCSVLTTAPDSPAQGSEGDLTIIYLPLIPCEDYTPYLDPAAEEFCATYNFTFTSEQTQWLAGLAAKNIEANEAKIKNAIIEAWMAKRRRRIERKWAEGPAESLY
ncbi:acyl transferase/acyl hydrolase/lysophospholipase [Gaertneriomyces semiglobifer]|nr:acyl transferase/acyl hydrolase/lysophospholipase [Gaertneriomyces semiglobifer]